MTTSSYSGSDKPLSRPHLIPPTVLKKGQYHLRFARTEADLEAVRKLRFQVFNVELGEGFESAYLTGLDEDEFDAQCQHLLVEHQDAGVVGTYRLQIAETALAGEGFYSQGEFDFAAIPESEIQSLVELGRACVAKNHRDRSVLFLLWCGLIAYMRFHGKRSFIGCSSLTSQDMAEGLRFYQQLIDRGYLHSHLRVEPLPKFRCTADSLEGPAVPVPTLFGSYLRHGGKILGPPAIDREFGTIDFLTYVEATPRHLRLFGGS